MIFIHSMWDHEGLTFPCLKSIYHGLFCHRLSSSVKKCLFGKEIFQYSVCSFLLTKNNLSQWNNKAMQWNG